MPNMIYAFGGDTGSISSPLSVVDALSLANDTLAMISKGNLCASARNAMAVASDFLGERIYLLGGNISGGAGDASTEGFSKARDTNTMVAKGNLAAADYGNAGASSDSSGYSFGGFNSNTDVSGFSFATETGANQAKGTLATGRARLGAGAV